MSQPKDPMPAKLVMSVFLKEKLLIEPVAEALLQKYGEIDMVSAWMPFDRTTYYEPEMGAPLFRRMIVFKDLIEQQLLPHVKQETNAIEARYAENGRRRMNIDPGYLLLERLVLATGKNFSHRIYIGERIYADLTLVYSKGKFRTLPWTFPDYADPAMHAFLENVRQKYALDLKRELNR